MLDSPEGVCAGQARFEYPATSVLFSKYPIRPTTSCEVASRCGGRRAGVAPGWHVMRGRDGLVDHLQLGWPDSLRHRSWSSRVAAGM